MHPGPAHDESGQLVRPHGNRGAAILRSATKRGVVDQGGVGRLAEMIQSLARIPAVSICGQAYLLPMMCRKPSLASARCGPTIHRPVGSPLTKSAVSPLPTQGQVAELSHIAFAGEGHT